MIMPDHLHALITLGERLLLGQTIQRLKAKTSATLRTNGVAWQRDFFDHRLRGNEDVRPVFLYVYLNPYRKNLCSRSERWPWFHCCEDDWAWFKTNLDADLPPPEWLAL
ncbi:MAG: hypothetical protein A3G75_12725 [Verrucomicrobia bacterium RIFCSPLOWO2_12_FULL_64_8]|nr:MAG: hypothetical protein A3G75_12725 [Verrucomicrobia bacterium RIFCSPLOWO2_12_FULL_64_8]